VSPLDLALDAAAVAWILYRQRRARRVRLVFARRWPILLGIVGLVQFVHYNETHSLGAGVAALVLGSCFVLAAAFGALRAATVELLPAGRGQLAQRAGRLTLVLWLVSLGAHLSLSVPVAALHGPAGATAGSAVLYLAVSLGTQNALVHRRAVRTLRAGVGTAARAGALDARSSEGRGPDHPPSHDA
jgi:hypothetical protein